MNEMRVNVELKPRKRSHPGEAKAHDIRLSIFEDSVDELVNGLSFTVIRGENPREGIRACDPMREKVFSSLIDTDLAQKIVDALYGCGVVPTPTKVAVPVTPAVPSASGVLPNTSALEEAKRQAFDHGFEAGKVSAMRDHIDDLRKMAFATERVSNPDQPKDGVRNFD